MTSVVIFLAFCFLLAAFSEPDNTSYVASTESETEIETESELMLTPSKTMYATTALNIRSGPGTEYAVLSTLQAGESLSVINQTDGWSEIEYNSGSAYVATKYITDNYKPVETNNSAPSEPMVWIPYSGSKYHRTSSCSGMKGPTQVTLSEAQQRGYTPCKKCY